MRLIAGRQQVGGNIAFSRYVGNDLDGFFRLGQFGEELGLDVAFQNIGGDGVASLVGVGQAVGVGFVQKDLGLQHVSSLLGNCCVIAERQVDQYLD